MKDEIKEMIDKTKKCLIAGYDLDIITQEEMGILWNYITNLQEENRQTKLLKERYQLEKEDYKSRNEKAIKYIKSFGSDSDRKNYLLYFNEIINKSLNILQGEDKDD